MGALEGPKNLTTYQYTNAEYILQICVAADCYSIAKTKKKYGIEQLEMVDDAHIIDNFHVPLAEKHTLLPATVRGEKTVTYLDQSASFDWMKCQIHLQRKTDDGELIPVGETYWLEKHRKFYVGEALAKIPKFWAAYVKEVAAEAKDIAGMVMGIEPDSDLYSRDYFGKVWPKQYMEMTIQYEFTLTENNQIIGKIGTNSKYFSLENGAFEFKL